MVEKLKRLIVAPHADDEVLGCGGLIAKDPKESAVVICTRPSPTRFSEMEAARRTLGYEELRMLGYPDGRLGDYASEVVAELDRVLTELQPEELYLPYPDLHQDHLAAYEAGMRSARASMKPDHWYVPSVYVYDVAAYSLELQPTGLRYSVYEPLDEDAVNAKARAMDAYRSECAPPPSSNNGWALTLHAQSIGMTHKLEAAEHFAPVRVIRKKEA